MRKTYDAEPTKLFFLKKLVNCTGRFETFVRGRVPFASQRSGEVPLGKRYVVSGQWITIKVFERRVRRSGNSTVETLLGRQPSPGFYWFLGLNHLPNSIRIRNINNKKMDRLAWYYDTYWYELVGGKEELALQIDPTVIQTVSEQEFPIKPDDNLFMPGWHERSSVR